MDSAPQAPTNGKSQSLILSTARQMYQSGGIRAFWPGLVSTGKDWRMRESLLDDNFSK